MNVRVSLNGCTLSDFQDISWRPHRLDYACFWPTPGCPMKRSLSLLAWFLSVLWILTASEAKSDPITHSFLALGADTYIRSGDGQVLWRYDHSTRDGWVLPNGNILLAVSKGDEYPGGAVVELTRAGKKVFEFKGAQSEVNTVQALAN